MTLSSTERPPPAPGEPAVPAGPRRRPSFEAWVWLYMRVSGLVLVFLALVHFALTHIVNDVVETDYGFVARRWENPLWRIFDWLLLALALLHGVVGLRWVIDDYVRSPGRRTAARTVAYGLTGALFALGTFTVVTF